MDPKVQKLIERALAENLTDARVSDIMYLNGYEQSAIDAALEELKKKRPTEQSPSASTQEETASMASPSVGIQDQQPQPSGSALPVGSPGRQVEIPAELARSISAYAKGTLAYNTGADFTSPEDMLARNEEFRRKVAAGEVREPGGSVILKMFAEEEREQARELDRIRKEAEAGQMMYPGVVYTPETLEKTRETFEQQQNKQREQANIEINKKLGGNFNLYEDDGTGKLVANPEKKEVFDNYVDGLNEQAEFRINQFMVDEAKEKAQVDPVLMPYTSSFFQSIANVGVSTISMIGEATGLEDQKLADAISENIRQKRLNNMYSAGINPEMGVTESLQNGDVDNAMKQILFAGTDFVPQIAAMIVNPTVGFSYAAAGASSSTYDQYRNRLDLSSTDKALLVGGSAVIELAMERLGIGDIKLARQLLKIAPAEVGTAIAKKKALNYLTPLTKGFLPEFAEEGGVSLLNQALAAKIAGEDFDVRAIIDEGLIGGVFGGTTVAVPQVLAAGMNGMASRARMKDFRAVTDRIAAIQEAMTNQEITQAEKDLLNGELVDLAMQQTAITNSSKEVYAGLDEKSQNELRQVHQDLNKAIEVYEKATDKTAKTLALRNVKMQLDAKAEIEARYDSKTQTGIRGSQQEGNFVGQVSKPGTGTKKTPPSGVVQAPETEIDPKFYQPEVEVDNQGRAIPYDPAKNDSDTFAIGAARPTNKLSEENASTLNRIFNVVSKISEGAKVVVHHNLQSLLNSNAAALQMYTDGRGTPKAYYDPNTNQFHVMSMEAYQNYNEATGKAIEGEKQYMHEMSHPILDQLIEADADVKERLFNEIAALSDGGNEIAGRALRFGKGYAESKQQMETIVEFFALMGDPARIDTLSESFIQKVKNLFNELLARIGMDIKLDTAQDVTTMARNLHIAMKTGATVVVSKSNVAYQKRSLQFSIDDGTTPAGSRLFNTPLEGVQNVVQKYVQRAGIDYRPGKNITQLNEERAKEIGQAYDRMKHDPKDPEVKKAYNAMAKETIAQYEAILEEGYVVEINNQEPYANSADMIADLRDNKVMKIFSTESGFGDTPITDDQRAENPLLRDSGYKDVNGLPLLVNDVFRFVHDFFGHAERGNSFGAKGEENAWDAHSRMYSPLARKAMTTETRGQNSWVNFSGVNDEAFKLRDKARALRKEGRTEEAAKLVEQVYEIMRFADQKIGLLPDKYVRNDYDEVEFSLDQSFVIREGEDVKFRNTNPAMAKVREAVWAERVLEQNPMFNFNGTEKIESAADVAYLFRHLESAVSENAFVVFSNPVNGEYRVQWLGTGGTTSQVIDTKQIVAAYQNMSEQLGSDKLTVTLVHNHPSGKLVPSNADHTILGRIEDALSSFGADVSDGVIINLDSGNFSTFTRYSGSNISSRTKDVESPVPYTIQSFARQELYTPSSKRMSIKSPNDVAKAISRLKRGVNEKLGYFVLNQANEITYSAILDAASQINSKVSAILSDVGRYGESVILFGNDSDSLKELSRSIKEPLSSMGSQLLDTVIIDNTDPGIISAKSEATGENIFDSVAGDIDFSLDDMPAVVADMPNGIKNAIAFASESAFSNKLDFKKALQERFADNESQIKKQYGIKSFKTFDQPLKDYLVDSYVNETLIAINSYPDALGWYDAKTKAAMGIMSLIHPELATDPVAEAAFKISVAVTSNGNKVFDNFKEADRQYRYYKKNGKFDSKYSIGTQSKGIKETFKFTNMILEKMSMENFATFLTSKFNAGDLKFKKGGKNVPLLSGFTVDTEVYGASIFGAKIGNGFFMNLYGQFDQLTMDRWFMRQYGRLTGTLLDIDPVKIKNGKARLSQAVKSLTAAEKKVLASVIPDFKGLPVVDLSHAINKASIVKEKRDVLSSTPALDELRKAGNSLSKNDSGEVEAPGGGKQRKFIVEVFNEVQRRLMELGIDITIADLQAVNWYPEKALYQTFQEGRGEADGATETSDNEQPDYESAAKRLALDNGITENQIQNVTGKQRGESARGAVARRAQQFAGDGARPSIDQLTQAILKVKSGESDGETYFSIDDAKPEAKNLRRTIERTVNRFDSETRQRVLSNPESYMTKQSVNALKDQLSMMSDDELVENMTAEGLNMVSNTANPGKGENDISVLAAVELINRKAEAGEDVSELLVDLAKLGTTVGRMLRHFAELKSSTPLGIVETIRASMKRANRMMTATQEERLTDIAGRFITAQQKVLALRDELTLEFDAAKEQELNKLTKELDAVTKELNKFTSILVPKKISDLLTTTIQGNLLTPISQVTNVFANLFQIGLSIPVRTAEIAGAKVYQMFTGKNLRSFRASVSALPYAMKRGGFGFMEAIQVILKGGATTEKIVHAGFVPGAAFLAAMSDTKFAQAVNDAFGKDVIKGDVLPRLANGKISAADRGKALYEGVIGIAPEIMFRFLALGDKPFSRFSEAMQMYQEAQKLGLKGEALRNFLKYPTKQAQKRAEQEGKKLTFQQDNAAASAIFQFQKIVGKIPTVGKALEFALKVSLPYVKTPANIFTETLMFAIPGLGFARGTHKIYKGETEDGISDLAKAATGQMIIMAANYLIANGLIKGAFTDEDDEERALAYLQQPPMTINRSGLERLLAGENPAWQPGDIVMRYDKMGIIGTVLGSRVTAIKNNLAEAEGKEEGYYFEEDKGWFEPFTVVWDYMGVPLATFQTLNQQSFLAGSSSLLKVLSGGASERDVDDWIITTFRALTAIPFPNTLSAFSRADREYMPDSKAQTLEGKFKYVVMDRLLDTDGMPARVDFLGNRIPQNPEGANKWIYNFVDPMKTAKTSDDKLVAEIYRLYSLEENPDVIPGFPTKLREVPKKHPIDGVVIQPLAADRELAWRKGLEDLQVEYGQYVASRLEDLFASNDYLASSNEDKVKRVANMLADIRDGKMKALKSPIPGMRSTKRNYKWYNDYLKFADEFFSEAQQANP